MGLGHSRVMGDIVKNTGRKMEIWFESQLCSYKVPLLSWVWTVILEVYSTVQSTIKSTDSGPSLALHISKPLPPWLHPGPLISAAPRALGPWHSCVCQHSRHTAGRALCSSCRIETQDSQGMRFARIHCQSLRTAEFLSLCPSDYLSDSLKAPSVF